MLIEPCSFAWQTVNWMRCRTYTTATERWLTQSLSASRPTPRSPRTSSRTPSSAPGVTPAATSRAGQRQDVAPLDRPPPGGRRGSPAPADDRAARARGRAAAGLTLPDIWPEVAGRLDREESEPRSGRCPTSSARRSSWPTSAASPSRRSPSGPGRRSGPSRAGCGSGSSRCGAPWSATRAALQPIRCG